MTFLKDERRQALKEKLTTIGMTDEMVQEYSGWPDNIAQLDINLAAMVTLSVVFAEKLCRLKAGDDEMNKVVSFIMAAVEILGAYLEEVRERKLNRRALFPNWVEATQIADIQVQGMQLQMAGQ